MTSQPWQRVALGPRARARPRPRLGPRLRFLICFVVAVCVVVWRLFPYDNTLRLAVRWNLKRLEAALTRRPSEQWVHAPPRYPVDLGDDVLVILKTGYGTKDRVPAWFNALSEVNEFKDILIIADYEGQTAQDRDVPFAFEYRGQSIPVRDGVADSVRRLQDYGAHPRIKKYKQLNAAIARGDEGLALKHCKSFGWELDAMKFMSGLQMAYQEFPNKKWVLLVDDDTFVIQPSLKPLLQHLNPNQPLYLGNAVGDFKARFAHGGSAVLLSRNAMRALFSNRDAQSAAYIASLDEKWGDRLLAKALLRLGIPLDETYSHLFNGEPPLLTKIRADRLCSPLLSFHKLASPAAMRDLGEHFRQVREPVVWNDLWRIYGYTPPWRVRQEPVDAAGMQRDWDYVGEPDESTLTVRDVASAQACKKHCDRRSRACLAWSWDPETEVCLVSHWMIVGREAPGRVSGVNLPRAKQLERSCIRD